VAPSNLFLLGLALTLLTAFGIVIYLRRPLHGILLELCGTQERAEFWESFSNVTIMLVPLIFAMQYTPELKTGTTAALELVAQLKWALAGLLTAVLILGRVISNFIKRQAAPTVSPQPATVPAAQ